MAKVEWRNPSVLPCYTGALDSKKESFMALVVAILSDPLEYDYASHVLLETGLVSHSSPLRSTRAATLALS